MARCSCTFASIIWNFEVIDLEGFLPGAQLLVGESTQIMHYIWASSACHPPEKRRSVSTMSWILSFWRWRHSGQVSAGAVRVSIKCSSLSREPLRANYQDRVLHRWMSTIFLMFRHISIWILQVRLLPTLYSSSAQPWSSIFSTSSVFDVGWGSEHTKNPIAVISMEVRKQNDLSNEARNDYVANICGNHKSFATDMSRLNSVLTSPFIIRQRTWAAHFWCTALCPLHRTLCVASIYSIAVHTYGGRSATETPAFFSSSNDLSHGSRGSTYDHNVLLTTKRNTTDTPPSEIIGIWISMPWGTTSWLCLDVNVEPHGQERLKPNETRSTMLNRVTLTWYWGHLTYQRHPGIPQKESTTSSPSRFWYQILISFIPLINIF